MPMRLVAAGTAVALATVVWSAREGAASDGRNLGGTSARSDVADTLTRRPGAAPRDGEEIYRSTCSACHGVDGTGAPRTTVGFATPLPDFTDCNFTSREPRSDWRAIIRDGGPVRSFSRIMPAFRDLLTPDEIDRVVSYTKRFCSERAWPSGDLNPPRAQRVEKAFPEDEVVLASEVSTRGSGSVASSLVYEKRFGARDQLEVDVPFSFVERPGDSSWVGGVGDLSLVAKHVLFSSLASGTIVSGSAGVILPTGDRTNELGSGTTAFEGNLHLGQLLPSRSFLQFQGGIEIPTRLALAPRSASWGGVLGTTVPFGPISRLWSPMIEVNGARDLVSGAPTEWDLLPQFQITLSALQHVRLNVGVGVPLTQRDTRHAQILAYLLWDTFDGPLQQGWKGWCPGCQP